MKHYRIIGDDNLPYFTSREEFPAAHKGKPAPVEVPRVPNDFEDWNSALGKWEKNNSAEADHEAGQEAIDFSHIHKIIEARLFVKGIELNGYLSAEAKALSIPISDLAESVIQKAEAALASEIKRRIKKSKGTTT